MHTPIKTGVTALGVALLLAASASGAAQRDDTVYHAVEARHAEALDLLKTLVDIDSGTGDIAGGRRIETILGERLKAAGAEVRESPAEDPTVAPNLLAVLRGTGKAKVLIIAHVDTVFGPGTAAKRPFRIEADRAYGPGVSDEKAGVVNAVTALETLHQLGFRNYSTITLLLDGSEEFGSPGSVQLIKTLARQNDVEFNMEPGDRPDALTVWRKGSGEIVMRVKGRAAHSGMVPQLGRNAAVELVHQLAALQGKFPQSGDGPTVNLTIIRAGDRGNIIPDFAEASFDVRFRQRDQLDAIFAKIKSGLVPSLIPDTTVTVELEGSAYPALTENPQIDALGRQAQAIYAELGQSVTLSGNGGASESAVAMLMGTPALDGLGFVGEGLHTDHEFIDLSRVTSRMYLFTRLLMVTCESPPAKSGSAAQ